jgi:protein-tyrosine phosphatase
MNLRSAQAEGSKLLVHCKIGINRSPPVVIENATKAFNWDLEAALSYIK